MSRRSLVLALGLAATVTLGGCVHVFDATTLGVPATLASAAGTPAEGQRFSVTSKAVYGVWGLLSIKQPSLEKALATQLVGGRSVADVRIRVRSGFTDILFSVLTAGLIVPRSVTIEGVVTPGVPAASP